MTGPGMYPISPVNPYGAIPSKDKVTAACLAFFFGWLGAHNFYLGYTAKAWIQLFAGFAAPIFAFFGHELFPLGPLVCAGVSLWILIEFFLILLAAYPYDRDATGRPIARR